MRFTAFEGWSRGGRGRQDGHPMYLKLTGRVHRPSRVAATVLGLLLALSGLAQAASPTPGATPTFDPNNPQDAKLQAIFQAFDAKRNVVEGSLQSVEGQLVDVENKLVVLRAQLAKSEAELVRRQTQLNAAIAKLAAQKAKLKTS